MTTFIVHDTPAILRQIAALPAAQQDPALQEQVIAPFAGMFAMMRRGQPAADGAGDLATARGWQMAPPADPAPAYLAALDRLATAGLPARAQAALTTADQAFAAAGVATRIETVQVGIFPFYPDNPQIARTYGYTGFGAIPGYLVLTLWPDDYTIPRVPALAAHEFHHQVRFQHQPLWPQVRLVDYLVAEGLAESFAGALYGEALIHPCIGNHSPEALAQAKRQIGAALDAQGFDVVRGYIFGDDIAAEMGLPTAGVPPFGGYAIGYQLVQAYLRYTGCSAAAATVTPSAEILAAAHFF
ncbi:MAG TPA: DUF2268 domain-containing putative Zn-dependent protease [Chloroflexia bacterium]|nr:DUF2268 domain-containing putative Zn-dependent protease [Chloroflexia bacterium]